MKTAVVFILLLVAFFASSCSRSGFINSPNAELSVSEDSIYFDTVFTTTGSVTQFLKIFNDNDQKLRLSNISLMRGSGSNFRMNVDGREGPTVSDIEMEAKDSIYLFVTVRIDPTQESLPFIIQDSIEIGYNGSRRMVKLSAWGQNANFVKARAFASDTTWTNDKPIVVIGGVQVTEGAVLTIEKGSRIFFHADAPLLVDGTLIAIGEKFDSTKIVFSGDRLDKYYEDHPGSWPGIYFRETSNGNQLKQVLVKNAYQGIVCESPAPGNVPKLIIRESVIDNCYDAGILAVNSSIDAENCLISNCGKNIILVKGGEYSFTHCTSAAVSNNYISHRQPVLTVSDFVNQNNVISFADLKAEFVNCIFWGTGGAVDDEAVVVHEGTGLFDVSFRNSLWKMKNIPADVVTVDVLENQDPVFSDAESADRIYDFRLGEGSPAIDAGVNAGVAADLNEIPRDNIPDIGAYEATF